MQTAKIITVQNYFDFLCGLKAPEPAREQSNVYFELKTPKYQRIETEIATIMFDFAQKYYKQIEGAAYTGRIITPEQAVEICLPFVDRILDVTERQ